MRAPKTDFFHEILKSSQRPVTYFVVSRSRALTATRFMSISVSPVFEKKNFRSPDGFFKVKKKKK